MTGQFNVQLRKSIPSVLSEKHNRFTVLNLVIDINDSLEMVFSSRSIKMSPHFVLGRQNVPCVAEVVNRSLNADCTDFNRIDIDEKWMQIHELANCHL